MTAVALTACSSSGGSAASSPVTLPSSLRPTSTTSLASPSTPSTAPTAAPSTTAPPVAPHGLGPAPDPSGAPAVEGFRVTFAGACGGGSTAGSATFTVGPGPAVDTVRFFVDGTPAAATGAATSWTVPGIPCDGIVHTVTLIATGTGGEVATRSVAVRPLTGAAAG